MPEWTPSPNIYLFTDASGSLGWGAVYGSRWLQGSWSPDEILASIEYKELYAICGACSSWGHLWQKLRILVYCDNEAVVMCLAKGYSKSPAVMDLIRRLFFVCTKFGFTVSAKHIPGRTNVAADALSRRDLQAFRKAIPSAQPLPDRIRPF